MGSCEISSYSYGQGVRETEYTTIDLRGFGLNPDSLFPNVSEDERIEAFNIGRVAAHSNEMIDFVKQVIQHAVLEREVDLDTIKFFNDIGLTKGSTRFRSYSLYPGEARLLETTEENEVGRTLTRLGLNGELELISIEIVKSEYVGDDTKGTTEKSYRGPDGWITETKDF